MSVTSSEHDRLAPGAPANPALLAIDRLSVEFRHGRRHTFRALEDVSLSVAPGETVAVIGESGAGKSTLGRAVLGLVPVASGTISFRGEDITRAGHATRVRLASRLQVVFQDPRSSLNPSRLVGSSLAEPLLHEGLTRQEMHRRVVAMLDRVGLDGSAASRYPREFSGGQSQRIAIARALMTSPDLVICDEALSALDLSVQAQIINLLVDLRKDFGLALVFIGHDLAVVPHLAHRVVVLRNGRVVESGPVEQVCGSPADPYTRALMAAAPVPDPRLERARLAARMASDVEDDGGAT